MSKDCEHSVVQLTRPVKLRRTPFRSRQSLRASIIYKGPPQFLTQQSTEAPPGAADPLTPTASMQETVAAEFGSAVNGALPHTDNDDKEQGKYVNTFICNHYVKNVKKLNSSNGKTLTSNRSSPTGVEQYRTMQSPVQLHTRAGR